MGCGIADFGQNSTFLGFHFVPRDLDSRRREPGLTAQGTSTRGAIDLTQQGPMAPRVVGTKVFPLQTESFMVVRKW